MNSRIVPPSVRIKKQKKRTRESEVHDVHVGEATFEELFHILSRLHFWAGVFAEHAAVAAELHENSSIEELTAGLEEKRFMSLTDKSLEIFEHQLMNSGAIDLWRASRALENHKFGLLETVVVRFPKRKNELKTFRISVW